MVGEPFVIEESDFKMEYADHNSFDLCFKNTKGDWKLDGYNMKLDTCLKRIMYHRINNKHDHLTIREFFTEVKRMHAELTSLLKSISCE